MAKLIASASPLGLLVLLPVDINHTLCIKECEHFYFVSVSHVCASTRGPCTHIHTHAHTHIPAHAYTHSLLDILIVVLGVHLAVRCGLTEDAPGNGTKHYRVLDKWSD